LRQKREHTVSIESVDLAEIQNDGKTQRKLELHFAGRDKTLLLNKTNSDAITYIHGVDTDAWIGKEIILFPTMVSFGGNQVEAIRLRPVIEQAAPAAAQGSEDDFGDIPF